MISIAEEFRHIVITTVYCFSNILHWRWPHQWLKHVGDHNAKKKASIELQWFCWCIIYLMDICCLLLYLSSRFKHYGEQFKSSVQHAVSGSHLSVSHHRNLGLVPGQSMRYFWWTVTLGNLGLVPGQSMRYFWWTVALGHVVIHTLSLSVTFHQCSILIFVLVLLYHKDKQAQWNILFY